MSRADQALVDTLLTTLGNAYAPYSNHPVAAVMECPDGQQFAGSNVEVAHYKGLCAEASAISAMITAGQRELAKVYVMGPGEHLCTPCGDCPWPPARGSGQGVKGFLVTPAPPAATRAGALFPPALRSIARHSSPQWLQYPGAPSLIRWLV